MEFLPQLLFSLLLRDPLNLSLSRKEEVGPDQLRMSFLHLLQLPLLHLLRRAQKLVPHLSQLVPFLQDLEFLRLHPRFLPPRSHLRNLLLQNLSPKNRQFQSKLQSLPLLLLLSPLRLFLLSSNLLHHNLRNSMNDSFRSVKERMEKFTKLAMSRRGIS